MKKKIKETYFFNDTFNMHYHIAKSKDEFLDILKEYGTTDDLDGLGGRCIRLNSQSGQTAIVIGVFNEDITALVHECVHAGLFTFEAISQKLSHYDETLAYLIGYIFRECQKRIKL